jgi:hypothetical protein
MYANAFPFGVYSSIFCAIEFDLEENESLPVVFSLNKVVLLHVVYLFHVLCLIILFFSSRCYMQPAQFYLCLPNVGTWLLLLLVSNLVSSKPNLYLTILQLG